MKLEFSRKILEKAQIASVTQIHPLGAELFHANGRTDGWTDMTELIVAFRNYANAPKIARSAHRAHLYTFCMDLRTYHDYSLILGWQIAFYN